MGRAYLKAMGLVISHASHTFGGRRIEGPQGGTPPPPKIGKAFEEGKSRKGRNLRQEIHPTFVKLCC